MRLGLTLAVVLGLAMVANAGITLNAVNNGPTAGVAGHSTWIVYLDSPEKVSGVDAAFTGNMHQEFAYGGSAETPYTNSPGMTAALRVKDSHIDILTTNLIPVRDFHETDDLGGITNKLAGWLDDGFGGFGGWTTASVGIKVAAQNIHLDFAQLIIPDGQTVLFAGSWTAVGVTGLPPFSFEIGVPEPATMSVLAVGALALIRRRR